MVEIAVKRLPVIIVLSAMVAGTWLLLLTSKPAPVVPIATVKPGVPPPAAKGSLRYSKSGPKRKSGVGNSAETPADDARDATGSMSPVPPKPVMAGQKEFVLPSRLKAIVDLHNQMPRPEQILNLSSADAAILADVYRQTTNLADRSSLTWALGVAGNEETVELLKNTLTNEFKDRQLTSGKGEPDNEELVMFDTLKAMGLLAARYDSARDFVLQGTDPANPAHWRTSFGAAQPGVNLGLNAEWLRAYFTAAERANAALSGDLADADLDGLANLAEFTTNSDPRSSGSGRDALTARVQPLVVGGVTDNYLTVIFRRTTEPGYTVVLQSSADIATWTDATAVFTLHATDDPRTGWQTLTYRSPAPFPIGAPDKTFYRLRVSKP